MQMKIAVIYNSKAAKSIFTEFEWKERKQSAIKSRSLILLSHLFFIFIHKMREKQTPSNRLAIDFMRFSEFMWFEG